jgi:lipid-binding SYLF domain-containing protein
MAAPAALLVDAGAGGPISGLAVLSVSTAKGAFLGGGFTGVDIELAMGINKAVYGPDFDVKETLARTEGELPEFTEIRKMLK